MPQTDPAAVLQARVAAEPLARRFGMEAIEVGPGRSKVAMTVDGECLNQLGSVHGGVTFSLIDEAFELACNSHGTVALALNLNVSFTAPAMPGDRLTAVATEVNCTPRTGLYDIRVTNQRGETVAVCQALAYRKRDALPFLEAGQNAE